MPIRNVALNIYYIYMLSIIHRSFIVLAIYINIHIYNRLILKLDIYIPALCIVIMYLPARIRSFITVGIRRQSTKKRELRTAWT